MDPKTTIIQYALARDALYRAVKADDSKAVDDAVLRMRAVSDQLYDLGHQLAEEE